MLIGLLSVLKTRSFGKSLASNFAGSITCASCQTRSTLAFYKL